MSEFDLIARFFTRPLRGSPSVVLGVGDDCALLMPAIGLQAISTDMLIAGRHFFPDADPAALGHKCLAVNLSDLAAMGARPIAFTLALSLPDVNESWLAAFAEGLFAVADTFDCALIGGDTTQGPLSICISIFGEVAAGSALRRDGAQAGDDVWVSGSLGDARLALAHRRGEITLDDAPCLIAAERMDRPTPRVALGRALAGCAHAAIDLSDGLCGDLGHILQRSNVGATIDLDALPMGAALALQSRHVQQHFAAAGGDDYELCFTASPADREAVERAALAASTPVTRIGQIDPRPGLRLIDSSGNLVTTRFSSFDHFTSK